MSEKILGGEIRKGAVIIFNGKLCRVNNVEHVKPGKGGAFAQVDMHDIQAGTKFNVRFRTDETLDKAFLDKRNLTLTYKDGDEYVLMDDQGLEMRLKENELGVRQEFLTEGAILEGQFHEENLINISWPEKSAVKMKVEQADKYLKGTTVTQKEKNAVLENGFATKVPCHIEAGQMILINPNDGSFISLA